MPAVASSKRYFYKFYNFSFLNALIGECLPVNYKTPGRECVLLLLSIEGVLSKQGAPLCVLNFRFVYKIKFFPKSI